ncbi:hypothetical protein ABN763_10165 [Spongiivirga sp. MCCC 1A20706]|uniref:hypothetical protein n=1 Tax=Spongiivirga sp. MCCC 1A20706 TaxID=3160963 RepID=UPI0039774B93
MKTISILLLLFCGLNNSFSQDQQKNLQKVEGWYFRAISGYPASVTFEPIVLFKDGSYYEITDEALVDLDFSKSKKEQKNLWGTWKRNSNIFTLTDNNGKSNEYDLDSGNWFKAFPFESSINLKGTYEKISGGDFGNGLYALFNSQLVFLDDLHFTHSKNSGTISYGSSAWQSDKKSGKYVIDGNLIEFEYNDGRKVRLSFAIGAEGDNVMDTDMLFIGGKAYVID